MFLKQECGMNAASHNELPYNKVQTSWILSNNGSTHSEQFVENVVQHYFS